MSETAKDLTAAELGSVKKQLQRIKALGEGRVTVNFKDHRLVSVGIFAEIGISLDDSQPSLDRPNVETELRD